MSLVKSLIIGICIGWLGAVALQWYYNNLFTPAMVSFHSPQTD